MTDADKLAKLALFDRPIAFHRSFITLGVGVAGALMLSQAVYWSKRTSNPDGWFYKSREEWEEETGLTRTEQERARKSLCSAGVMVEKRQGVPARLYYRVDQDQLLRALLGDLKELTLEEVLRDYRTALSRISKTAMMRVKKLGILAEYVDYSEVLRKHGMVCSICQQPILFGPGKHSLALAFDHCTPLAIGGSHTLDNLKPAHFGCNSAKADSEPSKDTSLPNVSQQEGLEPKQSSRLSVSKQEGLAKASKKASAKPAITETTAGTTAESTAETLSGQAADASKPAMEGEFLGADDKPASPEPKTALERYRAAASGPKDENCKTFKAWANYAIAYEKVYGVWPLWNATVAGQMAKFIDKVGAEEAPKLAAHYLKLKDRAYLQSSHDVSLMLRDAQAIYTSCQTGRAMNGTIARQMEATEANLSAAAQIREQQASQEVKPNAFIR